MMGEGEAVSSGKSLTAGRREGGLPGRVWEVTGRRRRTESHLERLALNEGQVLHVEALADVPADLRTDTTRGETNRVSPGTCGRCTLSGWKGRGSDARLKGRRPRVEEVVAVLVVDLQV